MAGGLILYTVDKLTRSVKSSRDVHVVSLSHAAGITRVELDVGDMQGSKQHTWLLRGVYYNQCVLACLVQARSLTLGSMRSFASLP